MLFLLARGPCTPRKGASGSRKNEQFWLPVPIKEICVILLGSRRNVSELLRELLEKEHPDPDKTNNSDTQTKEKSVLGSRIMPRIQGTPLYYETETAKQAADDDLLFFTNTIKSKICLRVTQRSSRICCQKTHAINKHEHRKPYENAGMQK